MNRTEDSKTCSYTHLAAAGVLGVAAATMLVVVAARTSRPATKPRTLGFAFKKGDPDLQPGGNKKAVFGSSEFRSADYTPAVESYLMRAYPASDVPWEATSAAREGWESLSGKRHSDGAWQLIGPSEANVPGVLNALGDSAPYITAGRVTALALSPKCGDDAADNKG